MGVKVRVLEGSEKRVLRKEGVMRKVWIVAFAVIAMSVFLGCSKGKGTGAGAMYSDMNDSKFQTITKGMKYDEVFLKASKPNSSVDADGNGLIMFEAKDGTRYRVFFEGWAVTKTEKISGEALEKLKKAQEAARNR